MPPATDRLFFAIRPDPSTARRVSRLAHALRTRHALSGRVIAEERMHLTLAFVGGFRGIDASTIAQAGQAGRALVVQPFEIMLDRATSLDGRPRRTPFVLLANAGCHALSTLHDALERSLVATGLHTGPGRDFVAHLTLLYDDRQVACEAIEPIAWRVEEVALVHSRIGRGEHRLLARWPLRNAPERGLGDAVFTRP